MGQNPRIQGLGWGEAVAVFTPERLRVLVSPAAQSACYPTLSGSGKHQQLAGDPITNAVCMYVCMYHLTKNHNRPFQFCPRSHISNITKKFFWYCSFTGKVLNGQEEYTYVPDKLAKTQKRTWVRLLYRLGVEATYLCTAFLLPIILHGACCFWCGGDNFFSAKILSQWRWRWVFTSHCTFCWGL